MKTLITLALLTLPAFAAQGADKVNGLICDQEINGQETKVTIEIAIAKKKAVVSFRNSFSINSMGAIKISAAAVQPILDNELEKMEGQTLEDKASDTRLAVRVDGRTFDQRPRLGIEGVLRGEQIRLSSCNINFERGGQVLW